MSIDMSNKQTIEWECYRPLSTMITFVANIKEHPLTTVIVKKSYDTWLYHVDENKFSLDLTYNVVKDLSSLSEEEFFQESLVWSSILEIELVRAIQKIGYETISNFNRGPIHSSTEVEY